MSRAGGAPALGARKPCPKFQTPGASKKFPSAVPGKRRIGCVAVRGTP